MLPYFTKTTEMVQYLIDLINSNLNVTTPPIAKVYYGAEDLIPDFPAVAVIGARRDRQVDGTHRYQITLRADVVVYHEVIQSATLTRQEVDEQAEAVEDLLLANNHCTVNGIDKVIFGSVSQIEPGRAAFGTELAQASRLRWEALSRQEF
jgi:hypothetical protein